MVVDHRRLAGAATVKLDSGEGATVRVFVSPLWTVMSSVFEVLLGWRRGCPAEWARFVTDRAEGLDLAAFRAFDRPDRTVPNFFLPVPPSPTPTLAEELAALRATPARVVRRDLRAEFGTRIPEEFIPYATDTKAAFDEFCSTAERYWDAVFAAIWPRMKAVLDREVVLCGRTLATEGVAATLAQIHTSFRFRDGTLRIEQSRAGTVEAGLGKRRLALIPVVAGLDANITSLDRKDDVVLAYAARGASSVWLESETSPEAGLVAFLGETRARILARLDEPASTTMLAAQLAVAPATVSHHLSALAESDLATSSRVGNSVYYSLTDRGRSLRAVFSD